MVDEEKWNNEWDLEDSMDATTIKQRVQFLKDKVFEYWPVPTDKDTLLDHILSARRTRINRDYYRIMAEDLAETVDIDSQRHSHWTLNMRHHNTEFVKEALRTAVIYGDDLETLSSLLANTDLEKDEIKLAIDDNVGLYIN